MKYIVFVLVLALLEVTSALSQIPDQPYYILNVGSPIEQENIVEAWHPIAFSPDGGLLAVASYGGLYVYDTRALNEPHLFIGDRMKSVAFSPDGKMLAAGGDHKGISFFHLWNLKSETHIKLEELGGSTLCFSPDSQVLVLSGGDIIRFWSIAREKEIGELLLGDFGVYSFAYRQDGNMLAVGGYNDIFLVDPDRQQILSILRRRDEVWPELWILCMEFSPDDTMLVAGSGDNAVDVWNVSEQRKIKNLWHGGDVRFVNFTPDGRQLVYGGWNRVIKLYDMVTGESVSWEGSWPISAGALCPDGKTLATASAEGIISFWKMPKPITGIQSLNKKSLAWGVLKK